MSVSIYVCICIFSFLTLLLSSFDDLLACALDTPGGDVFSEETQDGGVKTRLLAFSLTSIFPLLFEGRCSTPRT